MGVNKTISTTVIGPVLSTEGSITVTSGGVIDGGPTGVYAQSFGITTLSNSGSILGGTPTHGTLAGGVGVANSQTITTLINTGTIAGGQGGTSISSIGAGGAGVLNGGTISALTNAGGTIVGGAGGSADTGAATGADGVFNRNGATITTLTNFGTIQGGDGGQTIHLELGGQGGFGVDNGGSIADLFNTGKIESGFQGGTQFHSTFGVFNQTGATITALTNTGTIYGSTTGLGNDGAIADLFNTGTIEGGFQGPSGFSGTGLGVSNENGATISTLTNSGTIEGGFVGVYNAGTIAYLFNTGTIEGAKGPNSAALVSGAIFSTGSILIAKNSGKIDGEVFMAGSGEAFINQAKGVIDGRFEFGWYDSLCNAGRIVGDVTLGAHDWLGNRGDIQGDVALGIGDVYYAIAGSTVGELTGATKDLFEFSGKYGDVTIKNFAAGSGATHATLQFGADDFSSLTALQQATTQVNGDVVIRLDSTDAITLVNLKLSDLAAVDFKLL